DDATGDEQTTPTDDQWIREGRHQGTRYRFDRAGNLVERRDGERDLRLVWDANQRLVESHAGDKITRYGYDPLGRRLFKETEGQRTSFYWDGDALLGETTAAVAAETEQAAESSPDTTREYLYYPETFEPLALIEGGDAPAVYHYHNDPNGCPTRLTDARGEVKWAASYTAWGGIAELYVDEVTQPIRLQGQYADTETGLYYNRYRYFDAEAGQFVSADPLGLAAGSNVYEFAVNAAGWIDPLGLNCSSDAAKLRKAMEEAGELTPQFKNAAHHIVMSNSKNSRMKKLRDLFKKHGISINDADNGIFLPKGSKYAIGTNLPAHSKIHTNAYKEAVYDRLKNKKSEKGIRQALSDIKNDIILGNFP
ncbi:RHS repeat-associated core domain-containing protein, partial [Candidatus Electrothrix aarhusensis]